VTTTPAGQSAARTAGTDDLSYGQLAAPPKAARHLLDSRVLEPAGQRISAGIDARPFDLDGAHERWPGWRFSFEGGDLVAAPGTGSARRFPGSPARREALVLGAHLRCKLKLAEDSR
jgi:hypothetical protein